MPDNIEEILPVQRPTADRPLFGMTVLVVEDSRFASEAMRLLCLRSGARIRRADNLKSAHRHLSIYRPAVLIVDLGLPDGSGLDLIRETANATPRVGIILAISGDPSLEQRAFAAGADDFISKPIDSLTAFQNKILTHLPLDQQPRRLRIVRNDDISPDPIALHEDLTHVAEILKDPVVDPDTIAYVAHFLEGVGRVAHDDVLSAAAQELVAECMTSAKPDKCLKRMRNLVDNRLEQHKQLI